MIAFRDFFRPYKRSIPPLKLGRPSSFVLIRGADEERIHAEYDDTGRRMVRLIVHTRSK